MSESTLTSGWSIVGGNKDDGVHVDDGSSISSGVLIRAPAEDDVISLWSSFGICEEGDSTCTSTGRCTGSGGSNSPPAVILRPIHQCTTKPLQQELDSLANNNDDDDDGIGRPHAPHPRQGKRLLHHSLTKRERSAPAVDDYIEVVRRDANGLTGLYPKTPIDDLIPSLAMSTFRYGAGKLAATLGRDRRWETVLGLFEALERDGAAVRLAPRRDYRHYSEHHFRFYGSPPRTSIRFSVLTNGVLDVSPESTAIETNNGWHNKPLFRVDACGHDNNSINQRSAPKATAKGDNLPFEDGVDYVLHFTERRDDGTDDVRRRYTFKGMSYGDPWGGSRRDRARAARRRNKARAKKEMSNYTGGNV